MLKTLIILTPQQCSRSILSISLFITIVWICQSIHIMKKMFLKGNELIYATGVSIFQTIDILRRKLNFYYAQYLIRFDVTLTILLACKLCSFFTERNENLAQLPNVIISLLAFDFTISEFNQL